MNSESSKIRWLNINSYLHIRRLRCRVSEIYFEIYYFGIDKLRVEQWKRGYRAKRSFIICFYKVKVILPTCIYYKITLGLAIMHLCLKFIDQFVNYLLFPLDFVIQLLATKKHQNKRKKNI